MLEIDDRALHDSDAFLIPQLFVGPLTSHTPRLQMRESNATLAARSVLPHDLPSTVLRLPAGERRPAVYLSGNQLRHLRLGYLIQQRFPGLLSHWWAHDPPRRNRERLHKAAQVLLKSDVLSRARDLATHGELKSAAQLLRHHVNAETWRRLGQFARIYASRDDTGASEERMFRREVDRLRTSAAIHPTPIDSPNAPERVETLQTIRPYFLIAFGGPLLRGNVLSCARGLAINQHAGWSPELRGSATTETALYHRQLGWVGNTVHIMDTFADSGPILRRTTATVHPDDRIGDCFMAVVAVGTKLLLEVIETALSADELVAFPQPPGGQTVLGVDFTASKRAALRRDFANGWIADALRMAHEF